MIGRTQGLMRSGRRRDKDEGLRFHNKGRVGEEETVRGKLDAEFPVDKLDSTSWPMALISGFIPDPRLPS